MTQDLSREAYQAYLDQFAQYQKQWPRLAGQPKPHEEWAEAMQHRDHPRWPEYMRAHRDWKTSAVHIVYGPSVVSSPFPQFPGFSEWLAGIETVTKDYPALLGTNTTAGILDDQQ